MLGVTLRQWRMIKAVLYLVVGGGTFGHHAVPDLCRLVSTELAIRERTTGPDLRLMIGRDTRHQRAGYAVSAIPLRQLVLESFDLQLAKADLLEARKVSLSAAVLPSAGPDVVEPGRFPGSGTPRTRASKTRSLPSVLKHVNSAN